MKRVVKKINSVFLSAVLVIVYIVAIGVARVVYGFYKSPSSPKAIKNSYWKEGISLKSIEHSSPY
ncbi:hypothetical protein ACFL1A_00935 [Patescibacteria group bacterium]